MQKNSSDYKALNRELDEIIAQLQNPNTHIDDSLELYKKGQQITKELEQYLKLAKNLVKKLSKGHI